MTRPLRWWLCSCVHNMLVHPWLPLADLLDELGYVALPQLVYWAHDVSVPEGGG